MDEKKVSVELTLDELDGIRVLLSEFVHNTEKCIHEDKCETGEVAEYLQEEHDFYSALLLKIRTIQNENEEE